MLTGEGDVAGRAPTVELLAAFEFEETVVFEWFCETAAFAGGPFAVVNDAVNCCVIAFEEVVADVAEMVGLAEILAEFPTKIVVVFASNFVCVALSEFCTGADWFWSPEWVAETVA